MSKIKIIIYNEFWHYSESWKFKLILLKCDYDEVRKWTLVRVSTLSS